MNDSDNSWMFLLLLMAFGFENIQKANEPITYMDNDQCIPKNYLPINPYIFNEAISNSSIEWYKKLEELQKNCECIEWEQDMNANVPFCKLDGQLCNGQCRK